MNDYCEILKQYGLANNPPGAPITLLLEGEAVSLAQNSAMERLRAKQMPEHWGQVGVAFEDEYLLILRDAVQFRSGKRGTYLRGFEKPLDAEGVVLFPVLEGKLILVRHFRHATRNWSLEVPRGFGEGGATWQENTERELSEELGASAQQMIPLGVVHCNNGLFATPAQVVFVEIASVGKLDAEEGIDRFIMASRDDFNGLLLKGEISDGFTLIAESLARGQGFW